MAVLTCHLCEQAVDEPIVTNGQTFCCHGCRDLWRLLGDEQLSELKGLGGFDWTIARNAPQGVNTDTTDAFEQADLAFHLTGLWCASCGVLVQHVLHRLPGVVDANVNYTAESLRVQFRPELTTSTQICEAVSSLGYGIQSVTSDDGEALARDNSLIRRFAISVALSVLLMMCSVPIWNGYLPQLPPSLRILLSALLWTLTTPVVFWAGWPFLRGAWESVRHRIPTMDLLVSLASLAAYCYSAINVVDGGPYLYFDTCGFLVTFLLLGRILETGTRQRAIAVTRHLSGLTVREATVLCDGKERRLPVKQLYQGDSVVIRPGERVPVDGVVHDGRSDVDESFLTGEAAYVEKQAGDHVYAGTTNFTGKLVVSTERTVDDTVLAQTLRFVQDVQGQAHVYRRLTERVLRFFIPGVLVVSVLTFCLWVSITPVGTSGALLRAMAALVIACPCALSVAAPVATQCAVQVLGKDGVLLRSDEAIERCSRVNVVVFDKTGTLTHGRAKLTGIYPNNPHLLQLAASVEAASEHPFGRAVVEAARDANLPLHVASSFATHPGEGVTATVNGQHIRLCKHRGEALSAELDCEVAELCGHSLSVLWVDNCPRAVLAFSDTLRLDAAEAVKELEAAGMAVHMATGDRAGAAMQIADAAGIRTWKSGLTPVDKVAYIRTLQANGKKVAYVGDGVNDAAALIQADLGIAMKSGTDVAIQSGHLVLMRSQLTAIPITVSTCKQVVSIVRQNLIWAVAYNLGALIAAVAGFAQPAVAALAMVLSSAFVLGNALRILGSHPSVYARRFSYVVGSAALLFVLARYGM